MMALFEFICAVFKLFRARGRAVLGTRKSATVSPSQDRLELRFVLQGCRAIRLPATDQSDIIKSAAKLSITSPDLLLFPHTCARSSSNHWARPSRRIFNLGEISL